VELTEETIVAPFLFPGIAGVFVTLGIGFCFGFVLERAGFGNAKNLAAQFYLHDMRVLKVMFTAIVTAMLLLFLGAALGLVDYARLWVPHTFLGPAIVGGLALGIGFIVGGYCPGTSLVSLGTWKIDGAFFAAGVLFGTMGFAVTAPALWGFWNQVGAMGRFTLFELAGVDAGMVVLGVLAMAIGAFAFAEWVERRFASEPRTAIPSHRSTVFRRTAIAVGAAIALVTALIGQPTVAKRMVWKQVDFAQRLSSREVYIDPAELLGLMHNNQIRLRMLDVRSESDFNVFHLLDAERVSLSDLEGAWPSALPPDTIVVTMSNDEQAATDAWKRLSVHANVNAYVLAGGVNRWLDLYSRQRSSVPGPEVASEGPDSLRHSFDAAWGDRSPEARPKRERVAQRPFPAKVKVLTPLRQEGGGCG